jgi:DNA repair protein RadC
MAWQQSQADFDLNGSKIHAIPEPLRPREKAKRLGIESLSDTELLALILNQGIKGKSVLELASELLGFKGWSFLTSGASINRPIKGLQDAQWMKIQALGEIAKRYEKEKSSMQSKVSDAADVFKLYHHRFRGKEQEHILLIGLSKRNHIIFEKMLFQGTHQSVQLDSGTIFHELIRYHAQRFILMHNHPSGVVNPSEQDINTTMILRDQAKKIGLIFLDHIIVTSDEFYSMAKHF